MNRDREWDFIDENEEAKSLLATMGIMVENSL